MSDYSAETDQIDLRLIESLVAPDRAVGDVLPSEMQMAAATHSGRPQLREALRVLEAFGVLRSRRGARRVWLKFDPDAFGQHLAAALGPSRGSVSELFEIRHAFEITHLPQVMARLDQARERELKGIVARMIEGSRVGYPVHEEDEQLHRALFASVDNRVFEGISAAFWRLHTHLPAVQTHGEDLVAVAAMHARVLDAVIARDVRLAVHELDTHFWGVRRRLDDLA